jgi:signal transduction histidine kinase/HD-like signal output (HDOD) protein
MTPGQVTISTAEHTAKRVELILQQLDALPTLAPIAVQILELTSSEDSRGKDVVKLVMSDPALSAKVLKLCRCSERGRALNVTSVERAVLLLGFDALRSAVLSVQVFELLDGMTSSASAGGEVRSPHPVFDCVAFWHHSLAAASVCESLAGAAGLCRHIAKADAFVGGLLHDLGMLALHVLLPRSFDRVCQFAESHSASIDQVSRKMIGMDTHTAGRRLAEHWRLPHSLGDVLWLHGQPCHLLPDLPHRPQIALVTLADAIARAHCMSPAGHGPRGEEIKALAVPLELPMSLIDEVTRALPDDVAARAEALGMNSKSADGRALLRSISRANEALGRINASMRQRALLAQRQAETLRAISHFHDSASPGGSVVTVMGKVVESAAGLFGGGFFAILYQGRVDDPWQFVQFATDGRPLRSQLIVPPPGSTAVADLADNTQVSMQVVAMLPWLTDYLIDAGDMRRVQLLPLRCGWGVNAVLLHDCPIDGNEAREQLEALSRTWAAAIAAGAQHDGAKRLGEQLAESNRELIETQDKLAQAKTLAALGEIAAGAAHEMNNPLTIISGRAQILATRIREPNLKVMAVQIGEQSHRLSEMITALRQFAQPTRPDRKAVDFPVFLDRLIKDVRGRYYAPPPIELVVEGEPGISEMAGGGKPGKAGSSAAGIAVQDPALPAVFIDPDQMGRAIAELIRNAIESEGCKHIELRVQVESGETDESAHEVADSRFVPNAAAVDDRLKIQVTDDGSGLTQHALAHAFDPFFSAKPAGRQPGLGLAQARRLVEAHGGEITLENGRNGGAVATIRLNNWRAAAHQHEHQLPLRQRQQRDAA